MVVDSKETQIQTRIFSEQKQGEGLPVTKMLRLSDKINN